LVFENRNLCDLNAEERVFDEIICYETLEHIPDDEHVIRQFHRMLRPGGMLHLCCPFAGHPRHIRASLDLEGKGGHVRSGYTRNSYRRLLGPIGFTIDRFVGIGGRYTCMADRLLRGLRQGVGDVAAIPLFFVLLPGVKFDGREPKVPFSLYVRAQKETVPDR
jgi:SAM-dependent methyltransferase